MPEDTRILGFSGHIDYKDETISFVKQQKREMKSVFTCTSGLPDPVGDSHKRSSFYDRKDKPRRAAFWAYPQSRGDSLLVLVKRWIPEYTVDCIVFRSQVGDGEAVADVRMYALLVGIRSNVDRYQSKDD